MHNLNPSGCLFILHHDNIARDYVSIFFGPGLKKEINEVINLRYGKTQRLDI
jgi:hypothetical protein